ncbi:MAG: sulfatase-like hydrolase/transferase [Blastocatellia bacterium]
MPFLPLFALFAAQFPFITQASQAGRRTTKPNVILILADDLGYGDLACYGSQKNLTPHIDELARGGVRFTDFHSASAVCSPARASILTGRAPARLGILRAFRDTKDEYLRRETITLPELLKEAGYATAHVGKWHLGGLHKSDLADRKSAPPGPLQQGFDHYLAMNEEPEPRGRLVRTRGIYRQGGQYLFRDDKPISPSTEHLTEIETAEAERMIETFHQQQKPFFLNLWFDNPHEPYEPAPDSYLKPHEGKATDDDLLYRSMVAHLDAGVGRIVAKLRQLGIAGNTLVIFTSDNGATGPGSSAPLRAGKGTLFEGGIRVPMIAVWPEKIRAGATSNEFAISADLLPTICEAAGITPPRALWLDGESLLAHLKTGRRVLAREAAFWAMDEYPNFQSRHREQPPYATEAVRWGRWKLLARDGHPLALYYLETDLREQRNLLDLEWRIRDQMVRELRAWLSTTRMWSK